MQYFIKFAYTRVMTYTGVLTQNTGIGKAEKTSFLIYITVHSILDADNKKLLYYL